MAVTTDELRIKMFGEFSIEYGDKVRLEDTGRSRKVWNLLEFLVANRHSNISQEQLIEMLWKNEDYDNPGNALKNLIYRLRMMLTDKGLPNREYIVLKRGAYSWNNQLKCRIDTEEFDEAYAHAQDEKDHTEEERLKHYLEAIGLYSGRFLPRSAYEEWTIPISTYYHRAYLNCISGAYDLLLAREDYETIVEICNRAVVIDPYDEGLYEMLITALVRLGQHQTALDAYHTITDSLYNELGVNPSENLRSLYRDIMKSIKSVEMDLAIIKEDLNEINAKRGAYYCDYEIFKNVYRFVARTVTRTGSSVHILLFTITNQNNDVPDINLCNNAMQALKEAIFNSLRRGDSFARYSSTQYVVMLPDITHENSIKVAERIYKRFRKVYTNKKILLHYKLQPLDPIE